MGIVWIYVILWLISFLWLLYQEEEIQESFNNWVTPEGYGIAIVLGSFFLLGIFDILDTCYLKIKRYIMWKFLLWRIQYRINKIAKAHPEIKELQNIVEQVKDLRKENPNDN